MQALDEANRYDQQNDQLWTRCQWNNLRQNDSLHQSEDE